MVLISTTPPPARSPGGGLRTGHLAPFARVVCAIALLLGGCSTGGSHPSAKHSPAPTRGTPAPLPMASLPSGVLVPTDYEQTCSAVTSWCQAASGQIPASLRTALSLPTLSPGESCPVSHGSHYTNDEFGGVALGLGAVRPLVVPNKDSDIRAALSGVLRFSPGRDGWHQLKTLWFSLPNYQGPLLIRGRQLDGANPVIFGEAPALMDPQMPPGSTVNGHNGFREWPGATWLHSPGCYGWQVDGLDFTRVIVFRAVWATPSN